MKKKYNKKNFVRQRRSKAERRRIYRALRKAMAPSNHARRMRDWTKPHIATRLRAEMTLFVPKLRSFDSCLAVMKKIREEIN